MLTFFLIVAGVALGAGAAVAYRRRGNSGDPSYHGPAQTGYESGVNRHNPDTTGLGG
ncbi:hypothetical protein GCM10010168_39510 [Actinoplanes ianthinogenes]|uniref:Secreted protein n=1 Tax=Actinoplanes ianthinogenes TaxID=122358 RepID=A0ABN6CDQ8_9ACTN|nr:hypothetical protein [Actinoplanes ianthinogenes]BCJ43740.1 hypothetical protein Aiant_43970 [Actinoplanes ianthinogenes]GGR17944.1 hypothetical protein GCM10010168_39510 [Actinoplanes ianthinogenes]